MKIFRHIGSQVFVLGKKVFFLVSGCAVPTVSLSKKSLKFYRTIVL